MASVRDQKRIAVTGTPHVIVRTFHGAVEVRAWDQNEILVDIERRASTIDDAREIEVETLQEDGAVRIEAKDPRGNQDTPPLRV